MRKNIDKYNHYLQVLKETGDKYALSWFPDGVPEFIYVAGRLEMSSYPVVGVSCATKLFHKKKPTKSEVANAEVLAKNPKFNKQDVRLNCEWLTNWSGGVSRTSRSYSLVEVITNPNYSFNKEDLAPIMARNREMYEPRDGCEPCAYCGKQTKIEDMYHRTVISYKTYGPGGKSSAYCSSDCAMYDQYAHDG